MQHDGVQEFAEGKDSSEILRVSNTRILFISPFFMNVKWVFRVTFGQETLQAAYLTLEAPSL